MAAVGQCLSYICRGVVECGYENLWYMRQCVNCDATHGAIELTARVSAILQVRSPCDVNGQHTMHTKASQTHTQSRVWYLTYCRKPEVRCTHLAGPGCAKPVMLHDLSS